MSLRTRAASLAAGIVLLVPPTGAQGPPSAVRVEPVRVETVGERRKVTGEVRTVRRSRIAAEEPGRVVELSVLEGQSVSTGDLLCRVDSARLELLLLEVRAGVDQSRAVLREREADAERAERDLAILHGLVERRAANSKELDDAESDRAVAIARRDQATLEVAVGEARAAVLLDRISDCDIRAPFDGEVVLRTTEVGQWLEAGGEVCELLATDELEAWLLVPQRFFGPVATSGGALAIEVVVDATGETFRASEFRTLSVVDARARTFPLVVPLPRRAPVAQGMSVSAWVPTGNPAERLLVSPDAILRNEAGTYLYAALPGPEGELPRALLVPVHVLFSVAGRVVVESPVLAPEMLVVVEGNERLWPMAPIAPIESSDPMPEPSR